jgi:hypothetical protein
MALCTQVSQFAVEGPVFCPGPPHFVMRIVFASPVMLNICVQKQAQKFQEGGIIQSKLHKVQTM